MQTVNQPTAAPTAKVAAAGIGGSISIVLIWVLNRVGIDMPVEVASAITAIVSFLAGYFVKERA
jgi:putative flippase GtrA